MAVSENSLMVSGGGKRRVGSVCRGEDGATLSVWLPAKAVDEIITLAKLHRQSVSKFAGSVLQREIGRSIDLD